MLLTARDARPGAKDRKGCWKDRISFVGIAEGFNAHCVVRLSVHHCVRASKSFFISCAPTAQSFTAVFKYPWIFDPNLVVFTHAKFPLAQKASCLMPPTTRGHTYREELDLPIWQRNLLWCKQLAPDSTPCDTAGFLKANTAVWRQSFTISFAYCRNFQCWLF